MNFVVAVLVQWLVVVVFVVIVGVLALVVDFREVTMTSPPEMAHCAPPSTPFCLVCGTEPVYQEINQTSSGQKNCEASGRTPLVIYCSEKPQLS